MWEEHCVECSPPDCYTSCILYTARVDQKCARFVNGIVPNYNASGAYSFGAEITFRRWAKLESLWPKSPRKRSQKADRNLSGLLNVIERFAGTLSHVFSIVDRRRRISGAAIHFMHESFKTIECSTSRENKYDGFFIEIFLVDRNDAVFSFEVSDNGKLFFREKLPLKKGWNRFFFEASRFAAQRESVGLARLINNQSEDTTVVITWLHWIILDNHFTNHSTLFRGTSEQSIRHGSNKVKCCVFDLDNTLWNGVIGDDGKEGVQINLEAIALIEELDQRGVICAVASKNEFSIAWAKIIDCGLDKMLLFPKINWNPKSENIKLIAAEMNIGLDAIAFIDDNPFERAEVATNLPMVRIYKDSDIPDLLQKDEFDIPRTEISNKRRLMYLAESKRKMSFSSSQKSTDEFLRSCEMKLRFEDPFEHFERCHELLERTNQFNFTGRRFGQAEFQKLLSTGLNFCWSMSDRFGDYGIVGFLHIENQSTPWVITEFVMSCRVAEKRVEESLFQYLSELAIASGQRVHVRIHHTNRNLPIRKKLIQLGLNKVEEAPTSTLLAFPEMFEANDIIDRLNAWPI